MFAVTASLSSALLFVCVFMVVSADQKNIKAESGQNVTLPCQAPNIIIGVKWSRAGLEPEYVLFYRDEQFDSDAQHPSFKNRVDLQDRQMKDGDVSLILKNVTTNDNGTYKCGVIQTGTLKLISSITLSVVDPPGQTGLDTEDGGKEDGGKEAGGKEEEEKQEQSVGLIAGLSVSAVLLAAVVGFLVYRKHKEQKQSQHPHQLPDELQHGNGSAIHTESEKPALLKQTEG